MQLRANLAALERLLRDWPELFTVTAELDLRERWDPAVRAALDRHESGWRVELVDVFNRGAWAVTLWPEAAAETMIATARGVRLVPTPRVGSSPSSRRS